MGHTHDPGSGDLSKARLLGTMVLNFLITGAEIAGGRFPLVSVRLLAIP